MTLRNGKIFNETLTGYIDYQAMNIVENRRNNPVILDNRRNNLTIADNCRNDRIITTQQLLEENKFVPLSIDDWAITNEPVTKDTAVQTECAVMTTDVLTETGMHQTEVNELEQRLCQLSHHVDVLQNVKDEADIATLSNAAARSIHAFDWEQEARLTNLERKVEDLLHWRNWAAAFIDRMNFCFKNIIF